MNAARTAKAFTLGMKLQWRTGFYAAAAFSIVLWELAIFVLPAGIREPAMPYLIFGDLTIVGFFFITGAVFFERGERTLFAVLVTPMRFGEYLTAKLGTLTVLSLVLSLVIAVSGVGFGFAAVTMLVAAALCGLIFLLAGFISAAPFASIGEWFIPSIVVIGFLNIPLIHYSGLWEHPLFYAFPTQGSLLLLGSAFNRLTLEPWQWLYAVGYQLLWIGLLVVVARKTFDRFIVQKEGSA